DRAVSSTPVSTPIARSRVATVTITVPNTIRLAVLGWVRSSRKLFQWKVPMLTMIITATSAAIGIIDTHSDAYTTSNSSTTPAIRHDRRPRPPEDTLITDWPIIAQPAMPPKKPVTTLARPCPADSRR